MADREKNDLYQGAFYSLSQHCPPRMNNCVFFKSAFIEKLNQILEIHNKKPDRLIQKCIPATCL